MTDFLPTDPEVIEANGRMFKAEEEEEQERAATYEALALLVAALTTRIGVEQALRHAKRVLERYAR
jgi:hypothetical protein